MRPLFFALVPMLALTTAACASTGNDPARPQTAPLSGSQCLDPRQARTWTKLDDDTLLVDAGRYRYRLELSPACTSLGWTQFLSFRGDGVSGRVCGTFDDAILTRDYPCRIEHMSLISKEEYKQAIKEREAAAKARKAARAAAKSKTS